MRTVGVDFAAQPKNTALCIIEWEDSTAQVTKLFCDVSDHAIISEVGKATKVGIDVPLGWPRAFVKAVGAHERREVWPTATVASLRFRATDRFVYEKTGKWPLSVSSERIAVAAIRAAELVGKLGFPVARDGSGRIVEVYPSAALRIWGFDPTGYKLTKGADKRAGLVAEFLDKTGAWLRIDDAATQLCNRSDNAFDGLISALIARASALGYIETIPVGAIDDASREGWIALPTPASLDKLVS